MVFTKSGLQEIIWHSSRIQFFSTMPWPRWGQGCHQSDLADPHCLCLRRHDEVLLQRIGLIRHFAARNAGRWLRGSVCAGLEPSDCLSWPISVESYNDESVNAAPVSTPGDDPAAGAGCGIVLLCRPWLCPGNSSIPIARILPSMSTRLSFTRSC